MRSLTKRPVFATVVIATIALGTGLIAAIVGLLYEVLVRPLPYPQPERLAFIYSTYPERGWDRASASLPELRDLAARSNAFESVMPFAAFRNVTLQNEQGATLIETNFSDAGYLPAQGAQPQLGRFFTPEETREGVDVAVVILSHGFWQKHLGGRADVLGQIVRFNDRPFTVVGVLPAGYQDLSERWQRAEIFLPFAQAPIAYGSQIFTTRGGRELYGLARLKPGVTLTRARQEADRVALELAKEYPGEHMGRGFLLVSPRDFLFNQVRPLALALGAGALIVLLIACANLAHLFLVQGAARQHEFAIRTALGADRGALIRLSLRDVLVLTCAGGAFGVWLGYLLVRLFNVPGTLPVPLFTVVRIEPLTVAATLTFLAACAGMFGLWPAWRASRVDMRDSLQSGPRASGDRASARRRLLLISGEVALATLLLVGTGLTGRALWRLTHMDTGYRSERLLTALLDLPRTRYSEREELTRFARQLHDELQTIPGLEGAVVWGPRVLGRATYHMTVVLEGLDPADEKNRFTIRRLNVTPDAFRVLGIPLLRGRAPSMSPAPDSELEVVVSEKFARRFFSSGEAIGRRLQVPGPNNTWRSAVIVGVAAPVQHYARSEYQEEEQVLGDIYLSLYQAGAGNLSLLVRTRGQPAAALSALKECVARVDPTLALFDVQTMEERLSEQERPQQFAAGVFAVYGALATFLAALGVYGVLAFSVAQRTREFGVRIAVGATARQILSQLFGQGMRWIGLGIAVGLFGAWQLSGVASKFIKAVQPEDPFVFAAVGGVIFFVGLAAWLIPALRAARTDPIVALRTE